MKLGRDEIQRHRLQPGELNASSRQVKGWMQFVVRTKQCITKLE